MNNKKKKLMKLRKKSSITKLVDINSLKKHYSKYAPLKAHI